MSESDSDLKRRILAQIKGKQIESKFLTEMMQAYETILADERIVLSRPERNRLFKQILWELLTNMIEENT